MNLNMKCRMPEPINNNFIKENICRIHLKTGRRRIYHIFRVAGLTSDYTEKFSYCSAHLPFAPFRRL